MRCEQHKKNYSKLKTEFNKIAHDNRLVHSDLSNVQLQYNDLKDTSAKALNDMENEISDLKCQLEYIHTKLPTKAQEIQIKNELFSQAESSWGQRVADLLQEIEIVKTSETQLLSENQCLKSDLSRLNESASHEKIELNTIQEKKYQKLKESYDTLKSQYDPKLLNLEQTIIKQNIELDELRHNLNSSTNQVRNLDKNLRQKEIEIREMKEAFYKSSTTLSSKEAQLTLELEKVEVILEDTNLKLEEEKKKCWELTRAINLMKKDLIKIQDQNTESALNQEAILADQKLKHTTEKSTILREVDHYKRVSEEKNNRILNLKAENDSLRIKHDMRIKAIKEEMMMIRLENAKREIELDAKATQYQNTLEEVKQDLKDKQDLEKKKLCLEDRSDSNKQRTLASSLLKSKSGGNDLADPLSIEESSQPRNSGAQNSDGEILRTNKSRNCSQESLSVEKIAMKNNIDSSQKVKTAPRTSDSKSDDNQKEQDILQQEKDITVTKDTPKKKENIDTPNVNPSLDENLKDDAEREKNGTPKEENNSRTSSMKQNYDKMQKEMRKEDSVDRKSKDSKMSEKSATPNNLSYDDLYERYTSLHSKHTQFSGILKRSPFSFDDKQDT